MDVLIHNWTPILLMVLNFQFSILITANPTITAKFQEMPDLSIKCGECPCLNPCSQQQLLPPPPPPPVQYCNPPPPRFVYTAGITPPPPTRFIYVTGAPRNLVYPTEDPFNLQIYTSAALDPIRNLGTFLLVGCLALQLLVFC